MGPEERKKGSRGSPQEHSPDWLIKFLPYLNGVAVPVPRTIRACYGAFFGGPAEMGMDFV
jgi:hypothetical protein